MLLHPSVTCVQWLVVILAPYSMYILTFALVLSLFNWCKHSTCILTNVHYVHTSLHEGEMSTQLHLFTVPSNPKKVINTRVLQDGIELNWLPPTEPNGEVHYVIYYTPEGGTEQSIDTGSDLTHYNLTGLERNRVYTNIAVLAVNGVRRSGRSDVIAQYNHTPPGESCMVNNLYTMMTLYFRSTMYYIHIVKFNISLLYFA